MNNRFLTSGIDIRGNDWSKPTAQTGQTFNKSFLRVANVETPTFYADIDVPQWVQYLVGRHIPVILTVSWFDKNLNLETSGRKLKEFLIDSRDLFYTLVDWAGDSEVNDSQSFMIASVVGLVKRFVPHIAIKCAWDFPVSKDGDMWFIVECAWSTIDDTRTGINAASRGVSTAGFSDVTGFPDIDYPEV